MDEAVRTRVAVVAVIIEEPGRESELNAILHEYAQYIVGRMGIPYRSRGISVISVVVDAPQELISALSGRIGALKGVSTRTAFSRL